MDALERRPMDALEGVCVCSMMLLLPPYEARHTHSMQVHCHRQFQDTIESQLPATVYAVQKDSDNSSSICVQNNVTTGALKAIIAMVEYHQATLDLVQAAAEVSYSVSKHPRLEFCILLQLFNCCKLQQREFELHKIHQQRS